MLGSIHKCRHTTTPKKLCHRIKTFSFEILSQVIVKPRRVFGPEPFERQIVGQVKAVFRVVIF